MDFLLSKLLQYLERWIKHLAGKRNATRELAGDFEQARKRVLLESVINRLPVQLYELRLFFIESGLIARPDFRGFSERWLAAPFIGPSEVLAPGYFSTERRIALVAELEALEV